ncbi:MAG: hypothetical protein IJU62_05740 [Muribaculaceae bacterium]|nr:hypothetical protein [Muribaculaceae bacterium]
MVLAEMAFIAVILSACSSSPTARDEEKEKSPDMEIILYNDDTGDIRDGEGTRIAGFHIYGRSGTISMFLSTSINFFGQSTDHIYLHKGKAYATSHDYIYEEENTGIPYTQKEVGTEIHYMIYKSGGSSVAAVEKTVDQKIREAKTVEEVRKLIDGTTWRYTEDLSSARQLNSCWFKVEFKDGRYTSYYAQPSDGKWTKSKTGTYEIEEGRYSNTGEKYISVAWDGEIFAEFLTIPCEFKMTTDQFEVHVFSSFMDGLDKMQNGHYGHAMKGNTHYTGQMKFGDYSWD